MKPITKRKKKVPSVFGMPIDVRDISEEDQRETFRRLDLRRGLVAVDVEDLKPHEIRKRELSIQHGIPESHIFVDPGNGLELYKTSYGTWATSPGIAED